MSRILIVGGGCLGRQLTAELIQSGHAVRATTRTEAHRAAIESSGAECWIGTPDRLATLRGALQNVTIACWLLAAVTGPQEQVRALHGSRLELFLSQAIDTTVRGVLYDAAAASVAPEVLAEGERIVRALGRRNAIPVTVLTADPGDPAGWLASARGAVDDLLLGGSARSPSPA